MNGLSISIMKQKIVYYLIIISSFCASATIIFVGIIFLFETSLEADFFPLAFAEYIKMIFALLSTIMPLLTGIIFSLFLSSKYKKKKNMPLESFWKKKIPAGILLVLYIITWLMGVPAVHNSQSKWAIEEYETKVNKSILPPDRLYPAVKTYIAFPVFPFIIISYHEYHIAPLFAAGGWYCHVWYIKDVIQLFEIGNWIS